MYTVCAWQCVVMTILGVLGMYVVVCAGNLCYVYIVYVGGYVVITHVERTEYYLWFNTDCLRRVCRVW